MSMKLSSHDICATTPMINTPSTSTNDCSANDSPHGTHGAVAVSALAMGWCHGAGASIAPAALALLFTAGLAGGSAFALIPDLCREPQEQARANGAVAQMGNLGSSFGPPLMAALMPPWGMTGVVMPTLVFAVAGILLASWAATHLRGRKR